jgi:vitamin B12 transporter
MHPFFRLSTAIPLLVLVATAARAGDIAGSVRTEDGRPLPHIVLVASGPAGPRVVVTGPDGRYRVRDLPAGDYSLRPDAPGFVLSPDARVTVSSDSAVERLDMRLAPAPITEHLVVAATRGDAAPSTLGMSVSVLDADRIAGREASSFVELLRDLPGIAVARTGGPGSQSSSFLRGGESRFARILVDGVPVNQPGGGFDFGSALPLELERVEVVRGAASSLYGTDALAGVIHVVTRRAAADAGNIIRAEVEVGSFAWKRASGGGSGRADKWDWNGGLVGLRTDNEAPNSAFEEIAGAASVGRAIGTGGMARLVLRAEDSKRGTPGPTALGRPDLDAFFTRNDVTAAAHVRLSRDRFVHDFRAGLSRTAQLSVNPADSGPYRPRLNGRVGSFEVSDFPDPLGFQNDTARRSAGYQADAQLGTRHLLTGGVEVEHESGEIGARAGELISPSRTNAGLYLQDRVVLGDRVYATIGGRVERNASFGTRAVPRAAVAIRARGGVDATIVRASAGSGIKEPNFFETFGTSFFARGNPDLKPERSRTFDVGVEQRLLGSRVRAEATAFHHDYQDQIAFTVVDFATFQGSFVNLGRTRARGIELAVAAAPSPRLDVRAQYTLLDGEILVSSSDFDPVYAVGEGLLRRPRHQASLQARYGPPRANVGATLLFVGRRTDSDFSGLGLRENGSYTRLDVRGRVTVARGLEVFAVAENALDHDYQEALGYPAPGRSVRAGLRFRTGS